MGEKEEEESLHDEDCENVALPERSLQFRLSDWKYASYEEDTAPLLRKFENP